MNGTISFHFDDGHISHYRDVFPIFNKYKAAGCLSLMPQFGDWSITLEQALEMQDAGWEIMSHSITHCSMSQPLDHKTAVHEINESKTELEKLGFKIRQFITPSSQNNSANRKYLAKSYEAAFTIYTASYMLPIEKLVIERPVNRYELHRAGMAKKTLDELKAYVDYVAANDSWLVFYDHDIGVRDNITKDKLEAVVDYCIKSGVRIATSSEALESERCKCRILDEGFDGKKCLVHVRGAVHDNTTVLTAQELDVTGSDAFEGLQVNSSRDYGKTWTGFKHDSVFGSVIHDGIRTVMSDATPFYHKHTGKFIVTGHTVDYHNGENHPVSPIERRNAVPYSVFDEASGKFSKLKVIEMPDKVKYCDCGSGCSQCVELENGDIMIPVSNREHHGDKCNKAKIAVLRCAFDGETLKVIQISDEIEVKDSVRGIGEGSLLRFGGKLYLTIRDDSFGYIAESVDGIHFTEPKKWAYDSGETVPTYNTQSHWFTCKGKPYLVYTRKNGSNDHVFRNRAPLYAAEFDPVESVLKKATEFIVVPERGARLGNFGVCTADEDHAFVFASEWMQPAGCEKYGSNNAVWITEITG